MAVNGSIPIANNGGAAAGGVADPQHLTVSQKSTELKSAAVKPSGKGSNKPPMPQRRASVRIQAQQVAAELRRARRKAEVEGKRAEAVASGAAAKGNKRCRASKESVGEEGEAVKKKMMMKQVVSDEGTAAEDAGNGVAGVVAAADQTCSIEVKETIRLFTKHYLHFVQEEEKRCAKTEAAKKSSKSKKKGRRGSKSKKEDAPPPPPAEGTSTSKKTTMKRPDLKAISKMMENKEILYSDKRIGHIPGVEVGHQFFSRAEMVAVGFHSHWLNGIDYMGQSYAKLHSNGFKLPVAVSVVVSGMYEDDHDLAEDIVYTGQGGHNLIGDKRQIGDQKLERGNLALKHCAEQSVPVRVVRGHKSSSSKTGKVYTYDGLYKVVSHWAEKGISGFTVYKFQLRRIEGQPRLTTNQVFFTNGRVPQSVAEIRGLVCEDITGGQEDIPIPATNVVDDPPVPPSGFTYLKSLKVATNVKLPGNAAGCRCKGKCTDPTTCECALRNGSDFPYVTLSGGRLVVAKDIVYECGPNCGCGPDCVNRTSQKGLKYRLEVFRTVNKGWAVRSWDFIPSGAPVCEYTGVLARTEDMDSVMQNNYIFEIDCLQTIRGLGRRERRSRDAAAVPANLLVEEGCESGPEFCIDAGSTGNVARFINHCCEPNMFVQCVLSTHHDLTLARVMLFAADNIAPLQELTYDYGYELDSVLGPDGKIMQMPCYCGAPGCKKRLL